MQNPLRFLHYLIPALIFLSSGTKIIAELPADQTPVISRIIINYDSILLPARNPRDHKVVYNKGIVLSQRENNIAFEVGDTSGSNYRWFLEGFDSKWTQWHSAPAKEYTNLSAGKYSMHVQYVKPGNAEGNIEVVSFRVLPHWYSSSPAVSAYICFILLLAWAIYDQMKYRFARTQFMLEQIINARTEELILEKEKTESLLTNVLPKNTADELMSKGKAAKIKYNFVTVLFSDIQGFTKIAEEMNPEVLIDELDKFFFHFDNVVEKYGIEKIKTIGDAYMCAGGIPEKNRTNPVEIILAALEMQQYMIKLKSATEVAGLKYWDIRIGIHTGTVVAGVVGQKKLSYDIWGDTVNTASRMESSGEAGKINVSGTTYEFVREFFVCEHRGRMPVKYKGEIDMYFVNGIADGLRDENGGPNRRFIVKMQKIKLQDVEEYVMKMFDEEAPPNLYFHNSLHIKAICNQVDLLANAENIADEDYIHLRLAAVFLFTGFITDYDNAMSASQGLAEEILAKFNFTESDTEKVKKLVFNLFTGKQLSTADEILYDATYDYLGRVDYIKLSDKLLREETEYGKVASPSTWVNNQKKILENHEFRTATAKLLQNVTIGEQIINLTDFGRELK